MANNKKLSKKKVGKGFDIEHKEQNPDLPKQIINPPKEATDPSEMIKRA